MHIRSAPRISQPRASTVAFLAASVADAAPAPMAERDRLNNLQQENARQIMPGCTAKGQVLELWSSPKGCVLAAKYPCFMKHLYLR